MHGVRLLLALRSRPRARRPVLTRAASRWPLTCDAVSDSEYESDVEEEVVQDLSDDVVMTKYKLAAEIANKVLKQVVDGCTAGASIAELCKVGDESIVAETAAVYNKKNDKGEKVEKGLAFPTCVSVNNCVCHNSPPSSDDSALAGDGMLRPTNANTQVLSVTRGRAFPRTALPTSTPTTHRLRHAMPAFAALH